MVNDTTQPRGEYLPRSSPWYPGRTGADQYSEDGRFGECADERKPPLSIKKGLRELCQISGQNFFVAAEENGKVICFLTPLGSGTSQLDSSRFFNEEAFANEINRIQLADGQSFSESQLGFNTDVSRHAPEENRVRAPDRHNYSGDAVDSCASNESRRSRKRPRAASTRGVSKTEDIIPMATIAPKKGIRIGDSDALDGFYDNRLRQCQQAACKIIAKIWIKAVEPKKQSNHPYTGRKATAPDWWPEMFMQYGKDEWKELRHIEPDHLKKEERVALLRHILRMLVEPRNLQHRAIRKVNLNLKTLESVTLEALSPWFSDKAAPSNASKRPILKEIFKVARKEERFKDGQIDEMTEVFVVAQDNEASYSESDDEDGDTDQEFTPAASSASSVELNPPQLMMPQIQTSEPSDASQFQGNGFPDQLPMRTTHYTHHSFDPELPSERPSYVEVSSMANHAPNYSHSHLGLSEMYPSPHGVSRRSSVFNSPSEYGSPATPAIYSPWHPPNASSNPSMYGFPPQPSMQPSFGGQMAQGSSYSGPLIDGLPRPTTDARHGSISGSRGVEQSAIQHQPAYSNYVADAGSLMGPGVKTEGAPHPYIPQ